MTRPTPVVVLAALVVALPACDRTLPPAATAPQPVTRPALLASLPLALTVKQRSTTPIPATNPVLRLTVDDITRGQVTASLATPDGRPLLAPTSFKPEDTAPFTLADHPHALTLKHLKNSLTGEDHATFTITPATRPAVAPALSEQEKIDRLLQHIASLDNAKFIRNGTEHSAKDAADHLRTKQRNAGARITTAKDFVDLLATKSSLSGDPYKIRLPDGTTIDAGPYLHNRLKQLEQP